MALQILPESLSNVNIIKKFLTKLFVIIFYNCKLFEMKLLESRLKIGGVYKERVIILNFLVDKEMKIENQRHDKLFQMRKSLDFIANYKKNLPLKAVLQLCISLWHYIEEYNELY